MQLQPWKAHCCSVDCYKTFQVVRGFSTGVYTMNEFKTRLKNIDLSNLENYREHIKTIIKDALKEDEVVEKLNEECNEECEEPVEEPVEESVENVVVEEEIAVEKPIYSRKRNYKTETE